MYDEGMPKEIRGKVWFLLMGNPNAISSPFFEQLSARGHKLKSLVKKHQSLETALQEKAIPIPQRAITTPYSLDNAAVQPLFE